MQETAMQENVSWTCQRSVHWSRDLYLYAQKLLTPEGKHSLYTVGFTSASPAQENVRFFWIMRPGDGWSDRLDYGYLEFTVSPAPTQAPVRARLYRDDVLVADQLVMDQAFIELTRGAARVGGTLSFGMHNRLKLHGASALTAVVTGPDGRELARPRFVLPDWKRADRFVKKAIAGLDRDALDHRNRCSPDTGDDSGDPLPVNAIRSTP